MSIPLYIVEAGGGQILTLDDPTVVMDGAAIGGTGGSAYIPSFRSTAFEAGSQYGRLRRLFQRVKREGTATLTFVPWRDGNESGPTITRTLALGDSNHVTVPLATDGSEFKIAVSVTAFSAPVELGGGSFLLIPRRSQR